MKILHTSLFLFVFTAVTAEAQVCETNTPPKISTASVTLMNGSSLGSMFRDNRTNLVWSRCPVGMQWQPEADSSDGLLGECVIDENATTVKYSWQQALQQAQSLSIQTWQGQTGWRLPTVKEFMSIIDTQCAGPPLHGQLFNGAPSSYRGGYWTSTPHQIYAPTDSVFRAWFVRGIFGELEIAPIDELRFVLLVK